MVGRHSRCQFSHGGGKIISKDFGLHMQGSITKGKARADSSHVAPSSPAGHQVFGVIADDPGSGKGDAFCLGGVVHGAGIRKSVYRIPLVQLGLIGVFDADVAAGDGYSVRAHGFDHELLDFVPGFLGDQLGLNGVFIAYEIDVPAVLSGVEQAVEGTGAEDHIFRACEKTAFGRLEQGASVINEEAAPGLLGSRQGDEV